MGAALLMAATAAEPRVGNAPVSWGVYEANRPNPPYRAVLDGIASAGYEGTELGPYGYMPTDPEALGRELRQRHLTLGSSFVALPLEDPRPEQRRRSVETAMRVARLLASQGVRELIIADDEDPARTRIAGRVPGNDHAGWSDESWKEVVATLHAVATALRDELQMRVVVHHHGGTFIETPDEIDRLLAETDRDLVGLLMDTGHLVYGGGDPVELLERHGDRVRYVHLKDLDAAKLARVRREDIPMAEAWGLGLFCPLGQGVVDFPRVVERLRSRGYTGWTIVEQDVVPDADGRLNPEPLASARCSRAYLREKVGL